MSDFNIRIQSKQQTYHTLMNIKVLFESLTPEGKTEFVKAMNRNTIRYIIFDADFSVDRIINFHKEKDKFQYQKYGKKGKLLFINKRDVLKVLRNIRVMVNNDRLKNEFKLN